MDFNYYLKYINKKTKTKYDISTVTSNAEVFQNLIVDLIKPFKKLRFDKVVSQEALGFILGGAIAHKVKKGFVPVRKGGHLPSFRRDIINSSFKDYSHKKKSLEMNKGSIKKGEKVLIVDDWIETGAQMKATIKLIEKQGGIVVGIAAINVHVEPTTKIFFEKYNCRPIHEYHKKK